MIAPVFTSLPHHKMAKCNLTIFWHVLCMQYPIAIMLSAKHMHAWLLLIQN